MIVISVQNVCFKIHAPHCNSSITVDWTYFSEILLLTALRDGWGIELHSDFHCRQSNLFQTEEELNEIRLSR